MIVLDTNVVSEPLRPQPDPRVVDWLATQSDVAITAVTVDELLVGVRRLPHGLRRERLQVAVHDFLTAHAGRVLPYDAAAAHVHADLRVGVQQAGRGLSVEDGMIAAITLVRGGTLATRNIADFEGLGVPLVDPWT